MSSAHRTGPTMSRNLGQSVFRTRLRPTAEARPVRCAAEPNLLNPGSPKSTGISGVRQVRRAAKIASVVGCIFEARC